MRKLLMLLGLLALGVLAWLFFGIDAKAQDAPAPSTIPATLTEHVSTDLKVVWGGGDPKTSSYSGKMAPVVVDMLGKNQLSGYAWGGVSEGSTMNAMKVTVNPTHLALCQADICDSLLGTTIPGTDLPYAFTTVQDDIADECLYLVTKNASYTNWGHVLENAWDMKVATGGEQSGAYGTWTRVLMPLYPDLADAELISVGGAKDIVQSVINDDAGFGFFVMRPDVTNDAFKLIAENELTLVPVIDIEMEGTYTFKSLKVASGGIIAKAKYHDTACTQVRLITGDPSKVDGKLKKRVEATIERISAIPAADFKQRVTEQFTTWTDYLDSVREVGADRLQKLLDETTQKIAEITK